MASSVPTSTHSIHSTLSPHVLETQACSCLISVCILRSDISSEHALYIVTCTRVLPAAMTSMSGAQIAVLLNKLHRPSQKNPNEILDNGQGGASSNPNTREGEAGTSQI